MSIRALSVSELTFVDIYNKKWPNFLQIYAVIIQQ